MDSQLYSDEEISKISWPVRQQNGVHVFIGEYMVPIIFMRLGALSPTGMDIFPESLQYHRKYPEVAAQIFSTAHDTLRCLITHSTEFITALLHNRYSFNVPFWLYRLERRDNKWSWVVISPLQADAANGLNLEIR